MQQPEGQGIAAPQGPIEPLRVLMPSPIGPLGLEIQGTVITRLRLDPPEPERGQFTPLPRVAGSDFLDELCGHLSEYFAGARRKLEIEYDLAPCGVDSFARRVLKEAAKIPYGKTRTYRALADGVGRPDAYRQVLSVLLENPLPILIPCHRVITNKSGPGSYIGGAERKRWLLEMERTGAEAV